MLGTSSYIPNIGAIDLRGWSRCMHQL